MNAVSLSYQPSQGQPLRGRWVLSTVVGDRHDPAFTLEVKLQHDYSGAEHRPEVYIFKDGTEYRVRSNADHDAARQAIVDHEGEEAAAKWDEDGENISESHCRSWWGWGTEDAVKDIMRRWAAIQLIVDPAITW